MERATIIVSGWVQGVGFRYTISRIAKQCSIMEQVENQEDGTVLIICEGRREHIENFMRSVRSAESPIDVNDIQVEYSEYTGTYKTFKIIPGSMEEEIVEGFSTWAMYLHNMNGKQDKMLEKQDATTSEIKKFSSGMEKMMDRRFQHIEDEIAKIKTKLSI